MFYNPETKELAECRDLCRRFNMSIPKDTPKVNAEGDWFLVDETAPEGVPGYYFVRTGSVEGREDGTYGFAYNRVPLPEVVPSPDEGHDLLITIEDRLNAVEDGLAEIAELIVEVFA